MSNSDRVSTAPFWLAARGEDFLEACYSTTPPAILASFAVEEAFVREHLPRSGRVLEVACGAGRFLARVPPGPELHGVDLVFPAVRRARDVLPARIPLATADAAALPYRDGAFDACLCVQASLGNFGEKARDALAEMRRVVKPGGCVLVTVYAETALADRLEWYRRLEGSARFGRIDPARSRGHLVVTTSGWASEGFARADLRDLLARAGLDARIETRDPILHLVRATPRA